MTEDINTISMPLPGATPAFVVKKDDFYTIVISDTLSSERQYKEYLEEINHIHRGDYDKDGPVDQIEYDAHVRCF